MGEMLLTIGQIITVEIHLKTAYPQTHRDSNSVLMQVDVAWMSIISRKSWSLTEWIEFVCASSVVDVTQGPRFVRNDNILTPSFFPSMSMIAVLISIGTICSFLLFREWILSRSIPKQSSSTLTSDSLLVSLHDRSSFVRRALPRYTRMGIFAQCRWDPVKIGQSWADNFYFIRWRLTW